MTTFDLNEVRGFAADLDARMDRCDNGEGMECATVDAALGPYAHLCCRFCEAVRGWGRAIFAGRAAFDPEVERVLKDEGWRLYARAYEVWQYGRKAEVPCYILDTQAALGSALWELHRLLAGWVTPQTAVGPRRRRLGPQRDCRSPASGRGTVPTAGRLATD